MITTEFLRRFAADDSGQDIIEYALLTAFVGLVGIAAWSGIQGGIGSAYSGWGSSVQQSSRCTPDPIASGLTTCAGGS